MTTTNTTTQFKPVSVTKLASLNMPNACPRCFWIDVNLRKPYTVFPSVFQALDKYQKKLGRIAVEQQELIIHAKKPYPWLEEIGDALGARYVAQLNAYAEIAEHLGYPDVSKLALVYWSPDIEPDSYEVHSLMHSDHIKINMYAIVKDVPLDGKLIHDLANRATMILSADGPPSAHPKCKNCQKLDCIMEALS